ncbi:MAG: hypothetical protein H6899_16260 [Rhodobacter sp.]|nr:hypothetical protein [Paracoccaceae bacterium]MCC0081461.1 hypothetical protein [Rhodobacter sp.]
MGLGDMLGRAAGALGGSDQIAEQIRDSGIDLSALTSMDTDQIKTLLADKGIDLSMLDSLGLSLDDVIAKVRSYLD